MPARLSKETVYKFLKENGCELLSEYENSKSILIIKCQCGHKRESTFDRIKTWKQFKCKDCTMRDSENPYFQSHCEKIHPKVYEKIRKQFNSKYERTKKYRDDFLEENYNQEFKCWDCGLTKNRRNFPYRKQYAFKKEKRCKLCNYNNGIKRRNNHSQLQFTHAMVECCRTTARKRKERGRIACGDFSITDEFIIELGKKQNNKCVYSGRELDWFINAPNKVSIDRINSSKGYVEDNVQLVCELANQAKNDMIHQNFLKFIRELYSKTPEYQELQEKVENVPNVRRIKELVKISRSSAKSRKASGRDDAGIHTITFEDVIDISYKQGNKCIYTGYNLWNSQEKASIDRIDSNLGYIKSNIQLITFRSNQAKSDLTENEFQNLIKDVYLNVY
tara:strand:+ start:2822 stop:3994 length:1173 start_codon:yes stop_codon:yes gene_type:complete